MELTEGAYHHHRQDASIHLLGHEFGSVLFFDEIYGQLRLFTINDNNNNNLIPSIGLPLRFTWYVSPTKAHKVPINRINKPSFELRGSWIISIDTISICILCCDSWNSIWLLVSDRIRTSLPNIIPNPTTSTFDLHILTVYKESGMASARFTKGL